MALSKPAKAHFPHGSSPSPALPSGVTLQAIDGETLPSSTTMSHNFYSRSGLSFAANRGVAGGMVAKSWDDPAFFPIGLWIPPILTSGDVTRWLDLGLNTAFGITSNSSNALCLSAGFSVIVLQSELGLAFGLNAGAETVGLLSFDEPGDYPTGIGNPILNTANAVQDGRFWWVNNTWNEVTNIGSAGLPLNSTPSPGTVQAQYFHLNPTPNAMTRHIDTQSIDYYWMSGFGDSGVAGQAAILTQIASIPAAQMCRAHFYGDMVDNTRQYQAGFFPAPLPQFVENGQPYTGSGTTPTAASYMTPPQLNAAVWATIIHGARTLMYFNHTFGGAHITDDNLADAYYQTVQTTLTDWGIQGGPNSTTSIYAQTKATNALVTSLANVINSPFAMGLVTAVSPGPGWKFGDLITTAALNQSGMDVMAKWDSLNFYIFALPRYGQSLTNQTATFTVTHVAGTTQVAVINESRTIGLTLNGGGAGLDTFSDTFADGNTVHIYKIN